MSYNYSVNSHKAKTHSANKLIKTDVRQNYESLIHLNGRKARMYLESCPYLQKT